MAVLAQNPLWSKCRVLLSRLPIQSPSNPSVSEAAPTATATTTTHIPSSLAVDERRKQWELMEEDEPMQDMQEAAVSLKHTHIYL